MLQLKILKKNCVDKYLCSHRTLTVKIHVSKFKFIFGGQQATSNKIYLDKVWCIIVAIWLKCL